MKKRIFAAATAAMMTVSALGSVTAGAFEQTSYAEDVSVYVNGQKIDNGQYKPIIANDRTLVRLVPIFEALGYSNSYVDMPINHKVFLAQFDAIKKLAERESCVIVGRCADYALEDNPYAVSVFIKASLDERVQRIKRIYELNDSKAADLIQKTDKRRASYYNYYSSKKWGEAKSYNLCIDSGLVGIDGAIDMILKFIELKEKNMGKDI